MQAQSESQQRKWLLVFLIQKIRAKMQQKENHKQSAKVVSADKVESTVVDLNEYLEEGDPDRLMIRKILVLRYRGVSAM